MVRLTLMQLVELGQVRSAFEGDIPVSSSQQTRLRPANPMRTKLLVINHAANRAHCTRRAGTVSTSTGRRLDATGGGFVDLIERSGKAIIGEYWALFLTADGNLYVEEEEAYLLPGQELA